MDLRDFKEKCQDFIFDINKQGRIVFGCFFEYQIELARTAYEAEVNRIR